MKCPRCEQGKIYGIGCGSDGPKPMIIDCFLCKGSGEITEQQSKWCDFGRGLRDLRISHNVTLSEAADLLRVDIIKLSHMECGFIAPFLTEEDYSEMLK